MKRARADHDNRAWRHPGQVAAIWNGAEDPAPSALRYRATRSWWETLDAAGITLLVTREYEHLLLALSVVAGRPAISYLPLPHPSGLAVDRRRNVVHVGSTRNPNQIYDLVPVTDLLPRFDMRMAAVKRPTLVPVGATMLPGSLYLHDLAFVGGRLHANASGHNAVVRIADGGGRHLGRDAGFEYAWWPRCAETTSGVLIQQNHLQLNSIAAGATLAASYFSASTDRISRRRPGHANFPVDRRGVVFSGATREPMASGLTRPHSARLRGEELWVLNSGYGQCGRIDAGAFHDVAALPGWTRGLVFHKRVAFVGTSRVLPRFRQYAPGLTLDRAVCGVHAVDAESGRVLGSLTWPDGNQIFAIEWVPRRVAEALPFVMGAPRPPVSLFYAYRPAGVRLP
jgi:uncharacterized protein (TIGR03032 family)